MFASIKSPTARLLGLLIVMVLLCEIKDAVEKSRSCICAKTSLPPSANASNTIAFEITEEKKEEGRNVPMSIKN
jgi:hypothetical protein